jgi:hypothetical protein
VLRTPVWLRSSDAGGAQAGSRIVVEEREGSMRVDPTRHAYRYASGFGPIQQETDPSHGRAGARATWV